MNPTPSKRALQITGAVLFLIGAAAVLVPAVASVTITLLVGWLLGFAGVVALVGAIAQDGHHRVMRALWGLLALGLGAYFVLFAPSGHQDADPAPGHQLPGDGPPAGGRLERGTREARAPPPWVSTGWRT